MLGLLLDHPGQVLTRMRLLDLHAGREARAYDRAVDTQFRTAKADYACFYGSRECLKIRKPALLVNTRRTRSFRGSDAFGGASGRSPLAVFTLLPTTRASAAMAGSSDSVRSRRRSCGPCMRRPCGASRGKAARRCSRRPGRAASTWPTFATVQEGARSCL
ncbi:helix-turn-helix domain-containing protein [Paracoccus mutanolyticus]|uniref:helix-turn-helix domain-containing protein n=1 Tax=Paracoccus mutanolyticus TaxID=1499308 RepID=UPI0037C8D0B0